MRCCEQSLRLKHKFTLFLLLLSFSFSLANQITIKLKDIAFINSQDVYLKDIADITTKSKALKKYISNLRIAKIKNKGVITKSLIEAKLQENLIDTSQINIVGDRVLVVLNEKYITANQLIPKINEYINKQYKNVKIQKITISPQKRKVIGSYQLKIFPKGKTRNYIYLTIKVLPSGEEFSVSVRYIKLTKAVVAKHFLPKGSKITPLDVKIAKVEEKPNKEYIKDLNEVIGKKVKRNIKEGSPISYQDLLKTYLVRRNSNVKVIYQRGAFKIELLGRALQNGELGDIIKVKNLSSGKVIQCKVIGANKVLFLSGQF